MTLRSSRSLIFTAAVLAGMLGVTAAQAQARDDGQDPNTAYGQSVIRNQEDQERVRQQGLQQQEQQQEQFRQQNQQREQLQQQQQYYGRSQAPAPRAADPRANCFRNLSRVSALAPIARKVDLGNINMQPNALFQIAARPTPLESRLLFKWKGDFQNCVRETAYSWTEASPAQYAAFERTNAIFYDMVDKLAAGQFSYGEFNEKRVIFQRAYNSYVAAH